MTPKKKTAELVSPKVYAQRRKVTRQAVMRAIAAGRLKDSLTRTDAGHWRIDAELADREWAKWTDPTKVPKTKAGGRPTGTLFPDMEKQAEQLSHARVAAQLKGVEIELRWLELEERRGQLIDRAAYSRAAFTLGHNLQQVLMGIPDRISADVKAAPTVHDVHELLTRELARALDTFARELGELAKGGASA